MYDKGMTALGTSAAVGTLAHTGAEIMWYGLGGFALVAAGLAIQRIVPRTEA